MYRLRWAVSVSTVALAQAATRVYNFELTWVTTNPDGAYERPTLGINGQWPLPRIEADVGDRVVVNVDNQLQNRSASLHFHGLYMNGTTHMDGPAGVTQCSIPPGHQFTYDFNITQPGTYWYHAHNDGQYPDGLRGPLIVHDPDNPFADEFDEELVLTLSDWYHDFMPDLVASFISVTNPTGAEPVPDAALMNDTQNLHIDVRPATTYMIRIVNMAAFAAQYLWFEGHTMRIIEVDGIYTEPAEAQMIYITAAQRYSVLLTTRNDTTANFVINGAMDQDLFDQVPEGLNPNVTGWLVYDDANELPSPTPVENFDARFDDFSLIPQDRLPLYDNVDYSIQLDFKMDNLGDGANYAFLNDSTYVAPKVPTLYTALTSPDPTDLVIYGSNTNSFHLERNQVVEIILNSDDPGKHPFHLHGHAFQAVYRGPENEGPYAYNGTFSQIPMRRDTFMVNPQSNIVLRFRADNPARIWLFHCHLEWHFDSGLTATMIEAPMELRAQNLSITEQHYDACRSQDIKTSGNAAGNTVDWTDLAGENLPPAPIPAGFTARGIVALVFSCISAFLGLAVIVWYGVGEIKGVH